MKFFTTLLLSITCLASVASSASAQKIDGQWKVTRGNKAGKSIESDLLTDMTLVIKGKTFTAKAGERVSSGTISQEGRKSGHTKLIFNIENGEDAGRKIMALYRNVSGKLKILFSQNEDFPQSITANEENQLLVLNYQNTDPQAKNRRRGKPRPRVGISAVGGATSGN